MKLPAAGSELIGARRLWLVLAGLALVVPLVGFAVFWLHGSHMERAAAADLEVIARLKAEQIENWLDERWGDSEVLAGDDAFAARVAQFMRQQHDTGLTWSILGRFDQLRSSYHYSKIMLLDASGRVLLASGEEKTEAPVLPAVWRQALASKQVQRRDIYRDEEGHIHLEWVIPIGVSQMPGERPLALVVLRVTAQEFLFPLIQSWPTASASGEILLLRRDGEFVTYLNQLRHRPDPPLTLRLRAPEAARADTAPRYSEDPVLLRVTDYRGVPALAARRLVAGTNWRLIAKIDRAEVLAPLWVLVRWVSLVALAALAVVGALLLLLWRQQQHAYRLEVRARSLAAIEESEQRYRAVTQSASDAIIIADSTGNIVQCNPSAARLFGYSQAELCGQAVTGLMPERFLQRHREGLARVASGGAPKIMGKTIEFAGLHRDGSEFPLELSLAQWQTAAGRFFSATLRDITERKQLERQLSRRLHHLDVMEHITWLCLSSKSIEELLGGVLDEILGVFSADRAWFLYPCDPDSPSWSVPLERTRPEWPGAFARGLAIPMTPEVAEVMRETLASTEPLPYGPATSRQIPAAVAEQFSIRSQMQMALHPREGSPWLIGLHHCAQARAYDEDELLIFKDIGQRVGEALSSMIIQKNLRESEANLNRAQSVGQTGSWLLDIPANRLEWSAQTRRMFGVPQQSAVDFETFVAAIHPDDRDAVLKAWTEAKAGDTYDIEHRIVVGGQVRWVRERAGIERDPAGRPLASTGTVQDITDRKAAEAKIWRLTQLYAALSQCNQAIVRSSSANELFPQICRDAVQYGDMKMAWIGLVDEASRMVRPVASYGDGTAYLDDIQVSLDDESSSGCRLSRAAVLENRPCWSQDFQHDPLTAPSHERAARFGWGAAASLPLRRDGVVIGAFTLYAGAVNAFDEDARRLLIEMATDISFALDGFERESRRKQAEQELAESERHFHSLFENMLEGYVRGKMLYRDGVADEMVFLEVNPAFEALTGLKDVIDKRASELIPGIRESNPELFDIYGQVALSGQPQQFETYMAGLARWFSISVYCPEPEHFVAIFDNITRRKQAEEKILELNRNFVTLLENTSDFIYFKDENSRFRFCSQTLANITGHASWRDMVGKHDLEVFPKDTARVYYEEELPVFQEGRPLLNKVDPYFDAQGRPRWVSTNKWPVFGDDEKTVVGLFGISRDITEQRQAEQVLAESEQRFRGLVEQSLAGIYIIQDGRFAYVNPRFAEIFGYPAASELIGVEPLSLAAEPDRGRVAENIRSRLAGEVKSISYGFTAVRKDGRLIDVGVHGAQATYGGRPAIIGLLQDVSEKKHAEEQIQRYIKQLEEAFMRTIEVATTLVELRDPYTDGHEKRVAQIAVAIGTELGLDARRIEGLRVGGYIHDIGKIIVPAEILTKPGRLSAAEYELIKGHPQAGYDILKNVAFPWPVAEIAYQHHERMDGSGYPRGLKGDEILLEARIMMVADVVEAMASHRPYRPSIGLEQALAEIERGRGTAYDPQVADACLRLFREKGYVLPA